MIDAEDCEGDSRKPEESRRLQRGAEAEPPMKFYRRPEAVEAPPLGVSQAARKPVLDEQAVELLIRHHMTE